MNHRGFNSINCLVLKYFSLDTKWQKDSENQEKIEVIIFFSRDPQLNF